MENRNFAGDLQISKVNKWYPGDVHAVKDMDMEIKRGEFIVFVGPSGCGKTTLLRMIAGLGEYKQRRGHYGRQDCEPGSAKEPQILPWYSKIYALYPIESKR